MYSIATVAVLTGLPPETIRAWECGAGLPAPAPAGGPEPGPYRDEHLMRLNAVAAYVDLGWEPAAAVAEVLRRAAEDVDTPGAPTPADDLATAFLDAVRRWDTPAMSDILDMAWDGYGPDDIADSWLLPMLVHLGAVTDAAVDRDAAVGGAHVAVELVRGRLMAEYAEAVRHVPLGAVPVLVGSAPGVDHDLGALAFAGLLARGGAPVTFLGGGLPEQAWSAAVRRTGARHIVLAVPRAQDATPTRRLADCLLTLEPGLVVHVGGSHQGLLRPPARRLGHDLATAADTVALALAFGGLG